MSLYLSILLADTLRYLVPAGLTWLLLTVVFTRWAAPRRLGPKPTNRQIRREIFLSALTVLIFAVNGMGIHWLLDIGVITIYRDVSDFGPGYLVFSLVALLVLHELYFYGVHRLLHWPWLFRHVHRWHHRSVHPTPWAAYAFHPVEAMLMAVFLPLALLLMPLHGGVIATFLLAMIMRNVTGHCGVELTTNGPLGRLYAAVMTTTSHHHQHHQFSRGNYGLYFRFSDRLFNTERADYAERIIRFSHPGNTGHMGESQ
ncbi:MAG: sterol desaturase family protein [Burkholderiaceae bacterium]